MASDLALGKDLGGPLNILWGRKQVLRIAYGSTTLWLAPVIYVSPDIDGGLLSEVAAWVDEIPIIGPFLGAGIGLIGELIAFLIPDGILSILGRVTSIMRSQATCNTDDSFVEVVVGSTGYKGLVTDVLAHYDESGAGRSGVGFRLIDSTLAMIVRTSSVTSVVEGCGLYRIGDVLRLETYGPAHLHTLFRNGQVVGFYSDLGGLTLGAGHRSVAVSMQAEIATVGGARSNSPNFASLLAGDLQTVLTPVGSAGSAGGANAPKVTGGIDFDVQDVSASPGGAGSGGGADHPWSVVLAPGWTWLDQQ